MQKISLLLISFILFFAVLLAGCFQGEQSIDEMDAPPENAEAVDSSEDIEEDNELLPLDEEDLVSETVARQLYLVDANGMLAAQTLELPTPDSKEVATQVLEYLVKEGPVTPILPNGFQAVLPEDTEVLGLNLQEDGTLIVDLSNEFLNYEAEEELNVLESITYTLTQFENINAIRIWINGHPQEEMPVNGTPIGDGYSRDNGINLISTDTLDYLTSRAVTMYYPAEYNDNRYFIPMTQYIETGEEVFSLIVHALIDGPGYYNNMVHVFNTDTVLRDEPKLEKGVLKLVFNKGILKDEEQAIISDEVMETLVRTLTEQQAVKAVHVEVEDVDHLVNENGEVYNEPVTKKTFIPVEKM